MKKKIVQQEGYKMSDRLALAPGLPLTGRAYPAPEFHALQGMEISCMVVSAILYYHIFEPLLLLWGQCIGRDVCLQAFHTKAQRGEKVAAVGRNA